MQMFNNVYPPEADYGPGCGLLRTPSISSMQHEPVSATYQPHDQNLPSPVYMNNQSINGHASDAGNMHCARPVSSVPSYHSQPASLESTGPASSHPTMSSHPTREDQASLGNENSTAHNECHSLPRPINLEPIIPAGADLLVTNAATTTARRRTAGPCKVKTINTTCPALSTASHLPRA